MIKNSENHDKEKKLDSVTDHHSEKIDDHEKRIVRLEKDRKGWIASV